MNFLELQTVLEKLSGKKITQSDFARILNVGRANISDRNKRNSQVNTHELDIIQEALNIKYYYKADDSNIKISLNTKTRCFSPDIRVNRDDFGKRLLEIQKLNNLSDVQMAGLMNITTQELNNLIQGGFLPNLDILNSLKQNFDISVDWLLYG